MIHDLEDFHLKFPPHWTGLLNPLGAPCRMLPCWACSESGWHWSTLVTCLRGHPSPLTCISLHFLASFSQSRHVLEKECHLLDNLKPSSTNKYHSLFHLGKARVSSYGIRINYQCLSIYPLSSTKLLSHLQWAKYSAKPHQEHWSAPDTPSKEVTATWVQWHKQV